MKTNVLKLLFCIFLGIAKLHASHIVGGKIDYQSLGGGNYEITYTEYIDCSGISSGSNVTLNMEPLGTCGAGTSQITLTQLGIPYDVTPLCPGTNSQCSGGGTAYGVNRVMYHTTINAANFPCSKYRIYYTNCCRNSSIVNLANGGAGLDFYIAVDTLNFAINNSSPFFINNPIIALCSGQSIDFSQAATDADGDSIVYALVPNLGLNGTPISYNIGYSLGNLLGAGWNVSINANTGKLSFTATGAGAIGIYSIAVCAYEYRNGIAIGKNIRDIQILVTNCGTGNTYNCCHADFNYTLTGGNTAVFTAIPVAGSNVYEYKWDFGDGTPILNSNTAINPTHIYSVTGNFMVKLAIYYNSPTWCADSVYYPIVTQSPVTAGFTTNQPNPNTVNFTDITTSTNPISSWFWDFGDGNTSTLQNPSHVYTIAGTYNVCLTATDNIGQFNTYCQTINVVPGPTSSFTYTITLPNLINFTSTITGGTAPYTYSWTTGINQTYTTANPTMPIPSTASMFFACLYVTDANGFMDSTCAVIMVNTPCDPAFNFAINGNNGTFDLINFNPNNVYTIDYGDGSPTVSIGPVAIPPIFSHTYVNNGIYTACMTASNPFCTQSTCYYVGINTNTNIDGYIYSASGGSIVDTFIVYLIESTFATGGTLTKIDSQYVYGNPAYYNFTNVNPNTMAYHTKAAMTAYSPNYANYIPTYHNSALIWGYSSTICLPCVVTQPSTYDITMIAGNNPGGPGFIGGLVSQGANKTGSPAEHIEVMLWDINDNPVTYTYTDANGIFGISNLAYGTYKVYPEVIGLVTEPYIVTISGMNPSFTGVDMTMGDSLIAATVVGVEMPTLPSAIAYPNPTSDKLTFQAELAHSGAMHLEMYNTMGQMVYQFTEIANTGKYTHHIDVNKWAVGVYTLKVVAENNGTQNMKVVISR